MRLVSFLLADRVRLGFQTGGEVVDALAALPPGANNVALVADARAFIAGGSDALALARRLIAEAPAAARRPLASLRQARQTAL
jgi:hypothetical protein